MLDVPTILIARTDANAAKLDHQRRRSDRPRVPHRRTHGRGIFRDQARHRRLHRARLGVRAVRRSAFGWKRRSRTSTKRGASPKRSTRAFPGKLLAYNCSPSFNWKKKLDDATIATFREQLNAMGYKFQFVTLAGFHALNYSFFTLAHDFKRRGMTAYAEFQAARVRQPKPLGYTATRHQREVGTGYFDEVATRDRRRTRFDDRAARLDRSRAVLRKRQEPRSLACRERRSRRLLARARSAGRIRAILPSRCTRALRREQQRAGATRERDRLARAHAGDLPDYLPPSEATHDGVAHRAAGVVSRSAQSNDRTGRRRRALS